MKTVCLIVLISTVSCICVSFCHPAKTLDERSTELAWKTLLQADQDNKQGLELLPKRITSKSIFITPGFGKCPEGHELNQLGQCVKFIQFNDPGHFEFLVQHVDEQYTNYDDEPEEVTGPFQINIPLDNYATTADHKSKVPIVMTPSSKHHSASTSLKVDVKRNGVDKVNVESVAVVRVDPSDVEMTTMAELTTTTLGNDADTTIETQTTTESVETTEPTTATTESMETTTLLEQEALFFQLRF